MIQVVPFTGTFANTGEHGDTAVLLCDVVDHFHEDNGLAHTGAAEQTHLAALREGNEQVYDLDAGFQQFHRSVLLHEARGFAVDGQIFFSLDGAHFVNGTAHHVHDAPKRRRAHRSHDRLAGIHDVHAADETFGRVHGDGAYNVVAQVLGHFADQIRRIAIVGVFDFQSGQNIWQMTVGKRHVNDCADDLNDFADVFTHNDCSLPYFRASAPPTISMSSLVMDVWRVLLKSSVSAPFRRNCAWRCP
jgi:hypothetical protein